eukprot:2279003-Prymnesium_polylepis.2
MHSRPARRSPLSVSCQQTGGSSGARPCVCVSTTSPCAVRHAARWLAAAERHSAARPLLRSVFLRGSHVRFMVLPDILKNAPFFKKIETKSMKQAAKGGKAKQAATQRTAGGAAGARAHTVDLRQERGLRRVAPPTRSAQAGAERVARPASGRAPASRLLPRRAKRRGCRLPRAADRTVAAAAATRPSTRQGALGRLAHCVATCAMEPPQWRWRPDLQQRALALSAAAAFAAGDSGACAVYARYVLLRAQGTGAAHQAR